MCCVLEGPFLINTTPMGSQKIISDYAKFLFTRFVLAQFKRGCHEVHVIFDNPGRLQNTPKYYEHYISIFCMQGIFCMQEETKQ